MDTKSLAKSKRAHSLHNKKRHHPNQKPKAATTTPATDKPPKVKAVKQKAPVLSSNWDRYEDEDDTITQNQPTDVVVPKSKGADYAYLISEAKSQNFTSLSSDIFPSLDDFVSDFGQGKESFFAVQGESLLFSVQNDSFFVEDKTSANYEASFLSLNMDALAKQLTNIDLPKRLFMEADFFPPEQHSEKVEDSKAYDHHEVTSSTNSSTSGNPMVHPLAPNSNSESVAKFEAKTAETELDMLLSSFDDVKLKEKASSTKKNTVDFDIDSTLDDLLEETSTSSLLDQNNASESQPVANTELLDDFDSWLDTI